VVGVVAPVGGEVEGHRQALLAGGEVALVEGVGLLGGGEAGVLAHRPGAGGVHGCPGPALEGGEAGQVVEVVDTGQVFGGVEGLDGDALGGLPGQFIGRASLQFLLGGLAPVIEGLAGKLGHGFCLPWWRKLRVSVGRRRALRGPPRMGRPLYWKARNDNHRKNRGEGRNLSVKSTKTIIYSRLW